MIPASEVMKRGKVSHWWERGSSSDRVLCGRVIALRSTCAPIKSMVTCKECLRRMAEA